MRIDPQCYKDYKAAGQYSSFMISYLVLFVPSLILGMIFSISWIREPRRFRNGAILLLLVGWTVIATALALRNMRILIVLALLTILVPLFASVFLIGNSIIVTKKEGFSMASLSPAFMGVVIGSWFIGTPILIELFSANLLMFSLAALVVMETFWFIFTFVGFLLYSWLYCSFPKRATTDFIIVLGCSVNGYKPTPLLAGRCDAAYKYWKSLGGKPIIICSGGKGNDEQDSEGNVMRNYLMEKGIPGYKILVEDKSVNTWQNIVFSKRIIDNYNSRHPVPVENGVKSRKLDLDSPINYDAAIVTSDYHVFRANEYAHKNKMKTIGVASATRFYYFPTGFIRDFIKLTTEHWLSYVIIAVIVIAAMFMAL